MIISKKIVKLLTISSLATIPTQTVVAMPECYVMDTTGKIVSLGFMCNLQVTTNETSNQTSPPQNQDNEVNTIEPLPENNQIITPTPPPSNTINPPSNNRGTVPTF